MATNPCRISRRTFLSGLGGAAILGNLSGAASATANALLDSQARDQQLFASACKDASGSYFVSIFDDGGQEFGRTRLPDRGHGIAISPDQQTLVAFARRPGTFALILRPFEKTPPQLLTSIEGTHFYGHGCFSKDGRLLYAVENHYLSNRGILGVYDVSGTAAKRLGEFETHGIGPHEVLLSSDGTSLIVANGGILTHPERPREKLNLDTMAPSIVYLNASNGDLRAKHELPSDLHQLSLRHMTLDGAGRAWIGAQFEGPKTEAPPLVAFVSEDAPLSLCELPNTLCGTLQNYIGSVTANASGDVIATSAPRAGKVIFWNALDGTCLGAREFPDGCGVAPIDTSSFLISDGLGGLSYLGEPADQPQVLSRLPGTSWDNHMSAF